jgi:hypothetical protein
VHPDIIHQFNPGGGSPARHLHIKRALRALLYEVYAGWYAWLRIAIIRQLVMCLVKFAISLDEQPLRSRQGGAGCYGYEPRKAA